MIDEFERRRFEALEQRLADLEHRLGIQEDIEAIRRLHYSYVYYNSARMTRQVLDLVSEDAESIEIAGRGVYYGKEGFRKNFLHDDGFLHGEPVFDVGHPVGSILVQHAGMDIITVDPDRRRAKGRFQTLTPFFRNYPRGQHGMNATVWEQEFVNEGGVWKIYKFKATHLFSIRFNADGSYTPQYSRWPDPNNPPDAPTTWYHPFPEAGVPPFHFANPVTGQMPGEVLRPEHYWIGNWPGEMGQSGHRTLDGESGAP